MGSLQRFWNRASMFNIQFLSSFNTAVPNRKWCTQMWQIAILRAPLGCWKIGKLLHGMLSKPQYKAEDDGLVFCDVVGEVAWRERERESKKALINHSQAEVLRKHLALAH